MATIAELKVKISTNNAKLKKGLASASRRIGNFAKKAAKRMAIIGAVIGAVVIGAFVKLAGVISRVGDEIDKLAKSAKILNIPVAKLQELEFAAKLSGATLSDLNTGLQKMADSVSDAATGVGEAKVALEELGLDAETLKKKRIDRQFLDIADALAKVKNTSDQVRIARDIFGRGGIALLNTLKSNLRETAKEFDRLGVSITDQQAAAIEA